MTMAVAIRGPAAARFYKTFHAWSRLGSVSHQHRRCFVQTSPVCEANRARPANWRQDTQHVQTSGTQDKQDGPEPEKTQNTGLGRHQSTIRVREHNFALMQQHPTFLDRMQAELDIKLTPAEHPTEEGRRHIRVESPSAHVSRYVRVLLIRPYPDMQALDDTVFYGSSHERPGIIKSNLNVTWDRAHLLKDNDEELKLRIEQVFSVGLSLFRKDTRDVVTLTGLTRDVNSAKDFIRSLELDSAKPSQSEADQSERPVAKSPAPSSVPPPPAQPTHQPTPQPTPQPTAQPTSQPTPEQGSPQSTPQPIPTSLKDVYKVTMRSVPSSVVVLTTRVPSAGSGIDSLRGMTVSSLCSITLEPEPVISFSIRGPSRTLDCITAGQFFTVNFLDTKPQAARIADVFSRPHDDPSQPFRTILASGLADVYESDDPSDPAMGGSNIPARFTCELLPGKSLEIGDHTVVFARVAHIWRAANAMDPDYKRAFLAYAQAAYRSLHGDPVSLTDLKLLERAEPIKTVPVPQVSEDDKLNTCIYINGFPPTTIDRGVEQFLKGVGFQASRIKTTLVDGQKPGWFFVTFYSVEEAERAMRTLDGAVFTGGHSLTTSSTIPEDPKPAPVPDSVPQVSKDDNSNRRIRIDGIPIAATFKEVKDYIKNAGCRAKKLKTILGDDQNPSFLFATFETVEEAERAKRTLNGANLMGHTLTTSAVTRETRSSAPQPETTTGESQILDESSSAKLTSTETAFDELASDGLRFDELPSTDAKSAESANGEFADAYWRMALDDDIEDGVLEERAADQRALGEAQKPADHPAANIEGDKQDK